MGRHKDAYCEFHKFFGHTIEKCNKLNGWLAAKFIIRELNEIQFDIELESEKNEKAPHNRD